MSKRNHNGLFKRDDSQYWWISYTDASGKRTRKSTGTTDRKEAEAQLAKFKLEAHQQKVWGIPSDDSQPDYSFDEVLLEYLKYKGSNRRMTSTAKNLFRSFTGRSMTQIDDLEIKAYIRSRLSEDVKPATVNKETGLLSAAINYVNSEFGWGIYNPAIGKKLPEPEGLVRCLSHDEARQLIDAAWSLDRAPWLGDYILLALYTGCRSGELLGLEWDRVDFKNGVFILEAKHQKNRRRNSVPLNSEASEALRSRLKFSQKHCPDSPWVFCRKDGSQIQSLKKSWATACKIAGIENFRIHDLRHTFASWLVMENVPIFTVSKLLRHSTVKMTEKYAHLNPQNLKDAVSILDEKSRFGHAAPRSALSDRP